jgi:hypothetical protein
MTERRQRLFAATVAVLLGLFSAAMVWRHPQQLRAPAWVAYAACGAFVFAGLTLLATELGLRRVQAWLVAACVAALLLPGAWIAFGPGLRRCRVSLPFASGAPSEFMCRAAFGLGALLVAAMLAWAVLLALRTGRRGGE